MAIRNPFNKTLNPVDPFPDPFREWHGQRVSGYVLTEPTATDSLLFCVQAKNEIRTYAISAEDAARLSLASGDEVTGILRFDLKTMLEKIPFAHDGAIELGSLDKIDDDFFRNAIADLAVVLHERNKQD